jgi:TPR repeat protein
MQAAKMGHAEANLKLGVAFENGDLPSKKKNLPKALEYYEKSARLGNTEAQTLLNALKM